MLLPLWIVIWTILVDLFTYGSCQRKMCCAFPNVHPLFALSNYFISRVDFIDEEITPWAAKYICMIADSIDASVPDSNHVCEAKTQQLILNNCLVFRFTLHTEMCWLYEFYFSWLKTLEKFCYIHFKQHEIWFVSFLMFRKAISIK